MSDTRKFLIGRKTFLALVLIASSIQFRRCGSRPTDKITLEGLIRGEDLG